MTDGDPSPAAPGLTGAVVLTGGSGARMGGADKAGLEVGGVTLLERALAATASAVEVVVVGDQVPTSRPVAWAREDPAGGGPAAGLLAGLRAFHRDPDLVLVLAVDMPRVTAGTFARMRRALEGDAAGVAAPGAEDRGPMLADGAVLVDGAGRRQPLCAAYRWAGLQRVRPRRPEDAHNLAVRRLVAGLSLVEVPAVGDEGRDVDTWEDLRDLRGAR